MSAIDTIRPALAALRNRLPWASAPLRPAGARMIADLTDATDAMLVTACVNSAPSWVALYDVAVRMRSRLRQGKANVLAADRDALYKALAELEK